MKYNDQAFIELALQYKYVTQADVDKCLEIQKKLPGQVGIGEILRSHKYLEDTEYNIIITLLRYKTGPAAAKLAVSHTTGDSRTRDRHIAEVALREGLVSEDQLKECVEQQKKLQKEGQAKSLATIMVSRGYLSEKQAEFVCGDDAAVTSQYRQEDVARALQEKNREKNKAVSTSEANVAPISSLIIRQNDQQIGIFPLHKQEITIGRVQGADLVVNDCYVSRIHCKFICHTNLQQWELIDMMSCHGVFINEVKVVHRQTVKQGDLIRIGETILEVV
jgi:hypothetical protein